MAKHPLIPLPGSIGGGGGMRSICVGPGGFGAGFGGEGGEPIKKFTSAEALQALMDSIKDDPSQVQNHVSLVTSEARDAFRKDFWPAVFDPTQWTRVATHRPTKDAEGEPICGTDLEVREYENDYWMDNSRHLSGEVHTAFGEITEIKVKCTW